MTHVSPSSLLSPVSLESNEQRYGKDAMSEMHDRVHAFAHVLATIATWSLMRRPTSPRMTQWSALGTRRIGQGRIGRAVPLYLLAEGTPMDPRDDKRNAYVRAWVCILWRGGTWADPPGGILSRHLTCAILFLPLLAIPLFSTEPEPTAGRGRSGASLV